MGAGYNVTDTKAGVQLIITKEATTKDVKGEIYVLSDAAISIVGGSYSRLELTNKKKKWLLW
jgi:acylphosphatase